MSAPEDRPEFEAMVAALVDPLVEMQRGVFFGDTALSNAQGWAEYVAAAVVAALSVAPQPQPAAECGNCGEPYPGRHIIENEYGEHVVICPRHTALGSTTATHDGFIGACDLCAVHPEAS